MHRTRSLATLFHTAALATGCAAPAARSFADTSASDPLPHFSPAGENRLPDDLEFGFDAQVYPAGAILGVHANLPLSDNELAIARLGYNATDRSDFGKHDDEHGGGPGIGAGYRRYFGPDFTGWMAGARVDLWALNIDWKDRNGATTQRGSTDVLVLQPSVEGGYAFRLGDSGWRLDLTLSLGSEINVVRDGERVGEGPILLGGASLSRRF